MPPARPSTWPSVSRAMSRSAATCPVRNTAQPSSRKRRAAASPMPLVPPLTSTPRPAKPRISCRPAGRRSRASGLRRACFGRYAPPRARVIVASAFRAEEVMALLRLLVVGAGVLVVVLALVLVAAVLVRRALRRAGRRLGSLGGLRWRLLELRSNVQPPGPRRDAARLRCRLDAELRATADMLQRAPQGLIFRADATALLGELSTAAAELDAELAAIERFLDSQQQQVALATISGQVDELIETTYTARQTILRTAAEDRIRHLSALREHVAVQATALDNYQQHRR